MIRVESLSKRYALGQIGAVTLREAVDRAWQRIRGRDAEFVGPSIRGGGPAADATGHDSGDRAEIWALKDISFDVARGEVVGIIGRNGAGKSTLLKVLTRITEPSSGRAVLHGRVSSLLEVGTGFHPDLTGRENTYLNGAILGMKKREIDQKFDEIVAFSEVERFIDTPVKRYSSGMYVRLAFAVAAHLEPEILLVDEVLAVGDLAFQKKCLGKMENVARTGRTILFVSHNMAAVQSLCARAVLLENGRLTFAGTAQETVTQYIRSLQRLVDEQPLGRRTDRDGSQLLRFEEVRFCDGRRVPQNTLVSGQEVAVEVHYRVSAPRAMSGAVISIAFSTESGGFLLACRSDAVGRTFTVSPGNGTAVCRIPRLPLNQGRYTYTVIAYDQGGSLLDWVRDAGYIDVAAGDYYGTGKLPAATAQGVFIDYDWLPPGGDPA